MGHKQTRLLLNYFQSVASCTRWAFVYCELFVHRQHFLASDAYLELTKVLIAYDHLPSGLFFLPSQRTNMAHAANDNRRGTEQSAA